MPMGEAMFIGLKNKAPDESMVCSLVRLLFKVQAKESEQHISINFTSLFSCTSKKKNPHSRSWLLWSQMQLHDKTDQRMS